jgi:transposase
MRIPYADLISEREADLIALEHQHRGRRGADRVRFLRLLKGGTVASVLACVPVLGYSRAQLTRWWERYRAGGLEALLTEPHHPGSKGQMTAEAWADLEEAMKQGQIATLEQARQYLARHWDIHYQSVNGVWWHLHRRRARPKTGRRRHRRADA